MPEGMAGQTPTYQRAWQARPARARGRAARKWHMVKYSTRL